ncbi:MAG TPA: hypothetical protein VHV27_12895 [Phenylobacterium sp.]|jgi:hypothetical protein|nr:hypothetical protein [Phenylobacterium sp.]
MHSISPSDAALEGFSVLGRRWRAVAGWALANLVAWIALCVLLVVLLVGLAPFAGSRDAAGLLGAVTGALLLGVGGGLVELVIFCGLYRVELQPEAPGFLHLRLGRQELRVLGAVLVLALIVAPLGVIDVLAARLAARASAGAAFAVALAGLLAIYAFMLRFGLTPVIAFAEGRISPVESWRRTRGQTWRLIGMVVLLLFVLLLLAVVIALTIFVVSGLMTGFSDLGLAGVDAFQAHPGRYLFQLAVQLLLAPVWIVIGQAPWVAVYRARLEPSAA